MSRWSKATASQPRLWNQSKYRLAGQSFSSEGKPKLLVGLTWCYGGRMDGPTQLICISDILLLLTNKRLNWVGQGNLLEYM